MPNLTDVPTGVSSTGPGVEADVPRSVGRVLDLLEFVLAERSCNLTAAAAEAGLTPTTARRHLRALESRGYVDRDPAGLFSAGPTILRIAASLRDEAPLDRLLASAQHHLDALAGETGESTYLAVSDGRGITYVATSESRRAIRHVGWVGQQVPIDGTAVGAALADPGQCVTRTGAVEPDITAVSMALPPAGGMGIAVSIIGPAHRLAGADRSAIETALGRVVRALAHDLGDVGTMVAS
jgi:DNA-binding IclR family transcriptional regulator